MYSVLRICLTSDELSENSSKNAFIFNIIWRFINTVTHVKPKAFQYLNI